MPALFFRTVLILLTLAWSPASTHAADARPRLLVLTDFFKDPDDKQSMIRLLLYANEFEIEGLIATSLAYGDGSVRPQLLHETLADYAKVYPNLRLHERPGYPYPSPDSLAQRVKAGAPVVRRPAGSGKGFAIAFPPGGHDSRSCGPAEMWIGAGRDTPASEHIIRVVDRADPRPVWVVVWGGPMDLAQALWKIRQERSAAELARFVAKLRVYQISWQDTGAVWLWENFPELFRVQTTTVNQGLYRDGPPALRDATWVEANLLTGHGPLAASYPPANAGGKTAVNVKEGDTASFLHLLAPGLSDPEHPEWGGWGGRFQRFDATSRRYVETRDHHPTTSDPREAVRWSLARWNEAIAHEFAARAGWCVRPFAAANHPPVVQLERDASRQVLERRIASGETLALSAAGTSDPDHDALRYCWWHYREPGTLASELEIRNADTSGITVVAPTVPAPVTAHLILEVTDSGRPSLTAYRRVVLTITPR
jgi:hypothetical protein